MTAPQASPVTQGQASRLERKAFYCGTKPSGAPVMKFGWVAHLSNGKVLGDETVNRGLYGKSRYEPRFGTAADLRVILAERGEA